MPNRDGTGPNGGGPRTGRGNGNGWRSNREQGFGRGGTGFRRGRRFG